MSQQQIKEIANRCSLKGDEPWIADFVGLVLEAAADRLDTMNDSSGDAAAYEQREMNLYEQEREHAISDCAKAIRSMFGGQSLAPIPEQAVASLSAEDAAIIARQVFDWTKERDRLQDLIDTATGKSGAPIPEQVAPKVDTEEFRVLLDKMWNAMGSMGAARARNAIFRHVERLLATQLAKQSARPSDDDLWDATLRDRDAYHEWADKLAGAISKYFDAYIGEHSNTNLPWAEALEAIEAAAPLQAAKQGAQPDTSKPTDISQRLRERAAGSMPNQDDAKLMVTAAEEIERYYGGMLAWKKTAEKKDRDWQAKRMGRVDDRIASRLAAPVAQSTAGAAKGGITSLEGLTRYGVGGDGELQEMVCGGAYLVADIEAALAESRLAAPALNPSEVRQQARDKDAEQIADLILSDPDGGRMCISSDLESCTDGSMRFTVTNLETGRRFGVHLGLAELVASKEGDQAATDGASHA